MNYTNLSKRGSLNVNHPHARNAIKQELRLLGCINHKNLTKTGRRMIELPSYLPLQAARMIVEAKKEGCLEQVIAIWSIIQAGSLIANKSSYTNFTDENTSDLLASLDVWQYIRQTGNINLEKKGINHTHFNRALTTFNMLMRDININASVYSTSNDRKKILKCCLLGLVTNCYSHMYEKYYMDCSTNPYTLNGYYINHMYVIDAVKDIKSCIPGKPHFLVGIPRPIYYEGTKIPTGNIITFATKITDEIANDIPFFMNLQR